MRLRSSRLPINWPTTWAGFRRGKGVSRLKRWVGLLPTSVMRQTWSTPEGDFLERVLRSRGYGKEPRGQENERHPLRSRLNGVMAFALALRLLSGARPATHNLTVELAYPEMCIAPRSHLHLRRLLFRVER